MCLSKAEAKDILWGWGKEKAEDLDDKNPLGFAQIKDWSVSPSGKGGGPIIECDFKNPYFKMIDDLLQKMDGVFYHYAEFLYVNSYRLKGDSGDRKINALEKICVLHPMNCKQYEKMVTAFWIKVTAVLG